MANSNEHEFIDPESYALARQVSPQLTRWFIANGNVEDGLNTDVVLLADFQYLGGKKALSEYPQDTTLQNLKIGIMDRVLETTGRPVSPPAPTNHLLN